MTPENIAIILIILGTTILNYEYGAYAMIGWGLSSLLIALIRGE